MGASQSHNKVKKQGLSPFPVLFPDQAIHLNRLQVLQRLWAERFEDKTSGDPLYRLRPDEDGPWGSGSAQPGGEVGDRTAGGKRPPGAAECLKTGRSD